MRLVSYVVIFAVAFALGYLRSQTNWRDLGQRIAALTHKLNKARRGLKESIDRYKEI